MSETTFTLDGVAKVDPTAVYLVDWTKVERPEDLILIFASMGISFSGQHPMIEAVSKFLDLSKPIYPQQAQQPQPKDIKLPKLKTL